MPTLKRLTVLVVPLVLCLVVSTATAGSLLPGTLTVTGNSSFDTGTAFVDGTAMQGGDIDALIGGAGGVGATMAWDDMAVSSGTNPVVFPVDASFTHFDDGFDWRGAADATSGSDDYGEYEGALDFFFDVMNSDAVAWDVTFKVVLTKNFADAGAIADAAAGGSAFADSEFTVDDLSGEVFFTDLESDTEFGDKIDGVGTGTFGDPQSAGPLTAYFTFSVGAGLTESVVGEWVWVGITDLGIDSHVELLATVTIDSAVSSAAPVVPVPGAVWMGLGMLSLLAGARRIRSRS